MKDNFLNQALTLARVSNLPTVWTNCLAAWGINAVASSSFFGIPLWGQLEFLNPSTLSALLLGASLVYAGGCTLNDAFDEEFDNRYNPERPLPSGRISSRTVWTLGLLELGFGAGLLIFGAHCSAHWIALLILVVIAYDYLHKKWTGGFVLMGACRLLLWLGAATAGAMAAPLWRWRSRALGGRRRRKNLLLYVSIMDGHIPQIHAHSPPAPLHAATSRRLEVEAVPPHQRMMGRGRHLNSNGALPVASSSKPRSPRARLQCMGG